MKMRRLFALLVAAALLISLCGCQRTYLPALEDCEWKMSTVYEINGEELTLIACSAENSSQYPDAAPLELSLIASDEHLFFADGTHGITYNGSYYKYSDISLVYEFFIDTENGFISINEGYDDTPPMLMLSTTRYIVFFHPA